MPGSLIVPTLAAGTVRLRPFTLDDMDAVREASEDPHIPLITTVPAPCTEDENRFSSNGSGAAPGRVVTSFA